MRGPEAGPARDRKRAGRKAISPGFMPETFTRKLNCERKKKGYGYRKKETIVAYKERK